MANFKPRNTQKDEDLAKGMEQGPDQLANLKAAYEEAKGALGLGQNSSRNEFSDNLGTPDSQQIQKPQPMQQPMPSAPQDRENAYAALDAVRKRWADRQQQQQQMPQPMQQQPTQAGPSAADLQQIGVAADPASDAEYQKILAIQRLRQGK